MKHRYGRHGDKAWLRWRKKHFLRRASLVPAPQMAVLYVPLEFLSRIRKVTILMADGSELNIGSQVSGTVNGDTDKLNVALLGQIPSPEERFFAPAKKDAREEAEKVFWGVVDPYSMKPDTNEVKNLAKYIYLGNEQVQLALKWKLGDAQNHFLREYIIEYENWLYHFSRESGAKTEETQKLLVFARTDKRDDKGTIPEYADDRALIRASISLCSNGFARQENINEKVFAGLSERARLYQKFYDEFEPAKEED